MTPPSAQSAHRPPLYPFAALVGQETLRLALLLCAADPSLGVLLRGDKGAAKSTAARALAELLPAGSPFVNLPVGATEDRLLGGLDLERALRGESALKPGLLTRAHGGVLYVDEVNLLPAHLIDALLDVAASGVNVLEREGFSEAHAARFVLLGSMNPEEGALRPQLLDRFALTVEVRAPDEVSVRREVLARRLAFDADPHAFRAGWARAQEELAAQVAAARAAMGGVTVPDVLLTRVAEDVCRHGVTSLRADLALVRAARAHAALHLRGEVSGEDVDAVLPLVLAHRLPSGSVPPPALRPPPPPPPSPPPPQAPQETPNETLPSPGQRDPLPPDDSPEPLAQGPDERVFAPLAQDAPDLAVRAAERHTGRLALSSAPTGDTARGRTVRSVPDPEPRELDVRASLHAALARSGRPALTRDALRGRVREEVGGRLLLLLIDASGSHAQGERMRAVKGAALSLLAALTSGERAAVVAFRGAGAELLCPPTAQHGQARAALEFLPTGGRTPLAQALTLAADLLQDLSPPGGSVALFTDGRANVPLPGGQDPWQDSLGAATHLRDVASHLGVALTVIDTELGPHSLGRAAPLASALGADLHPLHPDHTTHTGGAATHADPARMEHS
ncbi:VWA domain-containing protein [Deinococcus aquiradiocola]|uniref:Magnesium chelatase n=1 Tax=Deinococcus aquiradiocola TaxID=393059 RepID=A0A917PAT0_9DEIO|nr:VWA domain-containing protein [Deinococcus aquiradiocola]GGJ68672.1 magnesium chelatase [Deinococcus aquiradiocola]